MNNLDKIIDNDIIIITLDNAKDSVIKYINSKDKLYNIKVYSKSELLKNIYFSYDEKTINYLINSKNINYDTALMYIKSMYYLKNNSVFDNEKLNFLYNLKMELLDKKLIYVDNLFLNNINNKKIYFFGFIKLNKFIKSIANNINAKFIDYDNNIYNHDVYSFDNVNDEITFIANDIIDKKLNLNDVYIVNINNDNLEVLRRTFKDFNIPININNSISLYDTYIGKQFLNDFDLEKIDNVDIKNKIINILNKYYFIDNLKIIKNELTYLFKHTYLDNIIYKNAVNVTDLTSITFDDDKYIYLASFNKEYLPIIHTDTDYISDIEKPSYIDKSYEENILETDYLVYVIKHIKNLVITFSYENLLNVLTPSPIIKLIDLKVLEMKYKASLYSNNSNSFYLSMLLDNYINKGILNESLKDLYATYNNFYNTYDNRYKMIDNTFSSLNLSYTKINSYYECSFKYYCNYVLNLLPTYKTFDMYIGNICHYILSCAYNKDFDFDKEVNNYLNSNSFDFKVADKLFLNKILDDLKLVIKTLMNHLEDSKFKDVKTEITLNADVKNAKISGIIDKSFRYNEKIALVDYKTGNVTSSLSYIDYGLNMQLLIYIYLLKKNFKDIKITGIYLMHILSELKNYTPHKTLEELKMDDYKLTGYTLDDVDTIEEFDSTFKKSKYIKGMQFTDKGFSKFSKILSCNDFDTLYSIAENKINSVIDSINNNDFTINPKIKEDNSNASCPYCPFKSVCYVKYLDYVNINKGGF